MMSVWFGLVLAVATGAIGWILHSLVVRPTLDEPNVYAWLVDRVDRDHLLARWVRELSGGTKHVHSDPVRKHPMSHKDALGAIDKLAGGL